MQNDAAELKNWPALYQELTAATQRHKTTSYASPDDALYTVFHIVH